MAAVRVLRRSANDEGTSLAVAQWLSKLDAGFPTYSILHTQVMQGRQWLAPPFSLTTRAVCARCNSGWMSRLEDEAKPSLIPSILGQGPLRVPNAAGQVIANWAVKTSIMFHAIMPDTPVSVGYRLASDDRATWQEALRDVACALSWVGDNAERLGVTRSGSSLPVTPPEATCRSTSRTHPPLAKQNRGAAATFRCRSA